ncbi:MAG: hypothetical protein WCH39_02940 [Schlesneria sp.]
MSVKIDAPPETIGDRLLFALVLLWSFLGMCFPLFDTDFWWHLKTGQWILEGNGIPFIDLYTFTDSEKPWIDLHWGFQVLIAILYRLGGVPLVTLVKSGTITAAIAVAWRAGGTNLPAWKKAALWLLPIICIAGRGNERPEMLSQLFLAMWLWIARQSDWRPGFIWLLPLVQVVWVNCHALFVLGLVVGFCYAVDAVVREMANGRYGLEPRFAGPDLRIVGFVGVVVAIACLINPYFEEGALFPLTLYRKFSVEKEFYCQNIGEFRPPIEFVRRYGIQGLRNVYLLAEIGTWLLTFFSFVWLLITKRKWSLFRLVMFAGFSHLAWQASRNTNIFAIVSGFIACENFADARHDLPPKTMSTRSMLSEAYCTNGMTVLTAFLCLAVVTGWWNEIAEKNKPFGLGEAPNWFIHDASKFASQPGFPHRAFVAHIGQAEVYVYHNGPENRVFMDARLEVCTQRTFELFNRILMNMAHGDPVWQTHFHEGELPVVILDSRISRPAINGMLMTPGWRLVFADRSAAVFLTNERADRLGLSMADPSPLIDPDGKLR